jgi:hypothetical protein
MTLDDINQRYLSNDESNQFLADLEDSLKILKTKGYSKLVPLIQDLECIQDCNETHLAVRKIAALLKVNQCL